MSNKLYWKDVKGGYEAEPPVETGKVTYHLKLSETYDDNGPYFNVFKKCVTPAHSYHADIDGMNIEDRLMDYTLDEARARCERDFKITLDKNQLEWFFGSGGGPKAADGHAESLLEEYAFNPNDGGEYRIYSDMHVDGLTDDEVADYRCYILIKVAADGKIREFEKDYITVERCKELAQEDLRQSTKTLTRE